MLRGDLVVPLSYEKVKGAYGRSSAAEVPLIRPSVKGHQAPQEPSRVEGSLSFWLVSVFSLPFPRTFVGPSVDAAMRQDDTGQHDRASHRLPRIERLVQDRPCEQRRSDRL